MIKDYADDLELLANTLPEPNPSGIAWSIQQWALAST